MTVPSFVNSFAGVPLSARRNVPQTSALRVPRCAMGDSVAPKITVFDTKNEQTQKVKIEWEALPPNEADAIQILGNQTLLAALKPSYGSALPAAEKAVCPDGVSPADFYFPKGGRNKAPMISMEYNSKIAVSMEEVNPVVGGISANSEEKASVAFWKAKSYKYSEADLPDAQPDTSDPVSTKKFERYFPSKLRNMAPKIEIRKPQYDGDNTAYIIVKNEYVGFTPSMAAGLSVGGDHKNPDYSASAVGERYFGDTPMAPTITVGAGSVEVSMDPVTVPESAAMDLMRKMN